MHSSRDTYRQQQQQQIKTNQNKPHFHTVFPGGCCVKFQRELVGYSRGNGIHLLHLRVLSSVEQVPNIPGITDAPSPLSMPHWPRPRRSLSFETRFFAVDLLDAWPPLIFLAPHAAGETVLSRLESSMIRKPFGPHTGSVVLTRLVLFGFGCVPECLAAQWCSISSAWGPGLAGLRVSGAACREAWGSHWSLCQPEFQCSDTQHRDRGAWQAVWPHCWTGWPLLLNPQHPQILVLTVQPLAALSPFQKLVFLALLSTLHLRPSPHYAPLLLFHFLSAYAQITPLTHSIGKAM